MASLFKHQIFFYLIITAIILLLSKEHPSVQGLWNPILKHVRNMCQKFTWRFSSTFFQCVNWMAVLTVLVLVIFYYLKLFSQIQIQSPPLLSVVIKPLTKCISTSPFIQFLVIRQVSINAFCQPWTLFFFYFFARCKVYIVWVHLTHWIFQ